MSNAWFVSLQQEFPQVQQRQLQPRQEQQQFEYKCLLCGKSFMDYQSIELHTQTHMSYLHSYLKTNVRKSEQ